MAEAFSGITDILIGYDTDLHFENGDIMTTTGIDYIEREVFKILITQPGDWKAAPTIGAHLNQITGMPNTRESSQILKDFIQSAIKDAIYPATSNVRVVPTNYDSVIVFIDIYVNSEDVVVIPFEFDYVTGFRKLSNADPRVTEAKSTIRYKINDISKTTRPNKYWSRIREDALNV